MTLPTLLCRIIITANITAEKTHDVSHSLLAMDDPA